MSQVSARTNRSYIEEPDANTRFWVADSLPSAFVLIVGNRCLMKRSTHCWRVISPRRCSSLGGAGHTAHAARA
jgi:hypothetical protein